MMKSSCLLVGIATALVAQPSLAQSDDIPGVTQVEPGVTHIDGSKVPTTQLSASELKAAIAENNKYSNIKKLFDVAGLEAPGPSGTKTYMYKMHDPETNEDLVVVLFVKGGKIVDYLIS